MSLGYKLMASTGSTAIIAVTFAAKTVQDMYPPQSEAPKIGSLVTKKFPDGTEKTYRVITATGHEKKTCADLRSRLESNTMMYPLYHSSDLSVPQSYAGMYGKRGAVAYIGINPVFPDQLPGNRFMETAPHLQSRDTRYENSGYFPLRVDVLNDEVDTADLCPSYEGERIRPDVQIVYIEPLTDETKVGLSPSIKRMFSDISTS